MAHEGVLSHTRVRLRHVSLPLVSHCQEEPAAQQEREQDREQDRETVQRYPPVPARFGRIEEGVGIETHDGPPDEGVREIERGKDQPEPDLGDDETRLWGLVQPLSHHDHWHDVMEHDVHPRREVSQVLVTQ